MAQVPSPGWNLTGSDAQVTMTDCVGTSYYPQANPGGGCQSYALDLYENWDSTASGAGDTDIWFYRTGSDSAFFYYELEMRESWNYDFTGTSRSYSIEIDVDWTTEASRGDYLLTYSPVTDHQGNTWNSVDEGGGGKVTGFQDGDSEQHDPERRLGLARPLLDYGHDRLSHRQHRFGRQRWVAGGWCDDEVAVTPLVSTRSIACPATGRTIRTPSP